MKKNVNTIYFFETLMLIFIVIYKFVILESFKEYADILNIGFWLLLAIIMFIRFKYPRDKNYFKGSAIRLIVISLFAFLIVTYSLGIFTGFTKYAFAHDIMSIIKNTLPLILIIISQEFIRYIVAKNSNMDNIKPIGFLMLIYMIVNILSEFNYYNFTSFEQTFRFVTIICFPIIAKEMLYTYITYRISWIPSLLFRISNDIYIFIFPFFPKLSDYLISLIGVLYPYLIYMILRKTIEYAEKSDIYVKKIFKTIILIPLVIITCIFVLLISGVLKYRLYAIGSNSMIPVYERGDSVIVENTKIGNIKEGYIIAFYRSGKVITHRVVSIKEEDGKYFFKTKGDNNKANDQFTVEGKNYIGLVKYRIKYLGYPSIWLSESFRKDK